MLNGKRGRCISNLDISTPSYSFSTADLTGSLPAFHENMMEVPLTPPPAGRSSMHSVTPQPPPILSFDDIDFAQIMHILPGSAQSEQIVMLTVGQLQSLLLLVSRQSPKEDLSTPTTAITPNSEDSRDMGRGEILSLLQQASCDGTRPFEPMPSGDRGVHTADALFNPLIHVQSVATCARGPEGNIDQVRDIDRYNRERPLYCPSLPGSFRNPFPFFNPIAGLTSPQFRRLVSVVARFKSSSSPRDPSRIVSVNYYDPLHGVQQSLMLVELHPQLSVLEFLDRRLPAVVRGVMGNRLDRDFVIFIGGRRLSREQLRNFKIDGLEEAGRDDLRLLCANPLYGHMLRVLSFRQEQACFCNLDLTRTDPMRDYRQDRP
ncbi:MAG: hypothetical protein KVP17_002784 [Porospora cf. gigantea B]|uniref:uncharacterized protein n=2 Tax=Porospora cf. gigantea B TaxID=2853592 RepID=UPI003571A712|nr:MAG: hypothetical protein KVP17_002784 [Porospora cf. gigantea B]